MLQTFLENTNNDEDDTMTPEDKKNIVSNFVEDFFKQNPESVLDPKLLFDLNNMALRLVESSPNTIGKQTTLVNDSSDIQNFSNLELKQMLGERLLNTLSFQDIQSQGASANGLNTIGTNNQATYIHRRSKRNENNDKTNSSSTSN